MNKKQVKNYLFECVMQQLEGKQRSKETQKYLDKTIKLEKKFCAKLSDDLKKEYDKLSMQDFLYGGSEACDEIKFAINFVVDLISVIR